MVNSKRAIQFLLDHFAVIARNRTAKRRRWQNALVCDKRDKAITCLPPMQTFLGVRPCPPFPLQGRSYTDHSYTG